MRTIFCSESYLYYITEGTVQIIRRYFMRLEKVQEALKTKKIQYEYTEENGCGSIDFMFRGLRRCV